MARRTKDAPVDGDGSVASRVARKIQKVKGLGDVVHLASDPLRSDIKYYISTQTATLDFAIMAPGIPGGRLTTIFGPEGGSKSTLVDHLIAECQSMGGVAALIETESRFERDRASRIGVNVDDLIIIQGATLEESFHAIEEFIDATREADPDVPVLVAFDSLAGSIPQKRLEADVGDVIPGLVAKFVNAELPKLTAKCAVSGVALVIVNQIRSRITMGSDPRTAAYAMRNKVMGQQYSMLAEWPLLFQSSLMLHVHQISAIGDDKEKPTGIRARVGIRKCSISPGEGYRAEYEVDKITGIDRLRSKFELLEDLNVIQGGAGGWYALDPALYPDEKKFQFSGFEDVMFKHPELEATIKDAPLLWKQNPEIVAEREVS